MLCMITVSVDVLSVNAEQLPYCWCFCTDCGVQLHAAYSGSINMQGYLIKHRPVTQLMGLFAQEWEMRW